MNDTRIRTRYQRMELAVKIAEALKAHEDPKVQAAAQEIIYALGAPMATLNNVLDLFTDQSLVATVLRRPTPADALLDQLRVARAKAVGVEKK